MHRGVRAVGAFVVQHKFRFLDLFLVVAGVILVLYAGLTIDIFANAPTHTPAADTLEFDELLAVIVTLSLGIIWAVRRLLRERRQVAERAAIEKEIRILAFHDPLTDLPNRRQFDEALKAATASPPSAGASHGILMLDLNGFKKVNDVFGHAAGDEVLIHVASRLSRAVREGDMVARLGGDEFAVLSMHLPSSETATGMALRIIEALQKKITTSVGEHSIGVAIGIALNPQDGGTPVELLRKADIALYRAKEQGVSAMRFFEEDMDAIVHERHTLERELRRALEADKIENLYQPLIDLKNGKVRAFEVLSRWIHPSIGEIQPERFLSIAEDSGFIGLLTDKLLARACTDASQWEQEIELAFNLSPLLLHDSRLPDRILEILQTTGFSPHRLEIEIMESALVRDLDAAQKTFGRLREAGVRIALNGFGTGYSNLYHLRNFKLDRIKIDRRFVGTMEQDHESDAIVRALVGLGSGLGLEVIAEGIDNDHQRRLLIQHGCDQGQGVYYGGALSAADALAFAMRT